MSFWAKLAITIEDLDCFKRSCEKNGIDYREISIPAGASWRARESNAFAEIHDQKGNGFGILARDKDGKIRLQMDTDGRYNSIVARLGANGGRLCRDYTEMVIRKEMRKQGGMVSKAVEQEDGGLVLRIAVGM